MIHVGNCLEILRTLPDCSVDSVVTDPPYGLRFMDKRWDYDVPPVEVWTECLRVLKPGGFLLAFAGTRTQHRMCCRIEDAGFEIRDMIAWVYGSGFPKSLDVAKAIDKAAGAEREVLGVKNVGMGNRRGDGFNHAGQQSGVPITDPATAEAKQWEGFGTALKPCMEPITVARKPLIGTVAENVLAHGTGGLNIDWCRVRTDDSLTGGGSPPLAFHGQNARPFHEASRAKRYADAGGTNFAATPGPRGGDARGRWPANLIHDGSDEVLEAFPQAPGQMAPASTNADQRKTQNIYGKMRRGRGNEPSADSENAGVVGFKMRPGKRRLDSGSAARFFYCAKPSKAERGAFNTHPTVKPLALMRYLCRLVTPPGGTVLDPYLGSGTTGIAAEEEGFSWIGIEQDTESVGIAERRLSGVQRRLIA